MVVLLALHALAASTALAQSLRGVVLQPDSATRAAGIVVVAATERGDIVARTLSGESGEFDFRVPGAGTYALRLLRVGYRPTTLAPIAVGPEGVAGIRAILSAEAVVLRAVTVQATNVCGTTEDAGHVIAQVWNEARTALTATELSVGAKALDVEWQAFQFSMDPRAERATDASVLRRAGRTERPFVSATPEALARDGYVVDDGRFTSYHAPDAAALLSDEFAATHCFAIEPLSREHPQWLGVAFRPVPGRTVKDIAGTLWIDRATSELRLLDYQYTNLPRDRDVPHVGGYVEFVRMPTGHWLISRWAIRSPRVVRRAIGGAAVPGGSRQDMTAVQSLSVTGGEVLRVTHGASTLYEADRTLEALDGSAATEPSRPSACGATVRESITIAGVVLDGGKPRGGAVVQVAWQGASGPAQALATVTDARGTFLLPCVARGLPLTVMAMDGTQRTNPMQIAAPAGRLPTLTIDFNPPGGGR